MCIFFALHNKFFHSISSSLEMSVCCLIYCCTLFAENYVSHKHCFLPQCLITPRTIITHARSRAFLHTPEHPHTSISHKCVIFVLFAAYTLVPLLWPILCVLIEFHSADTDALAYPDNARLILCLAHSFARFMRCVYVHVQQTIDLSCPFPTIIPDPGDALSSPAAAADDDDKISYV